jgi:hypothetical protein
MVPVAIIAVLLLAAAAGWVLLRRTKPNEAPGKMPTANRFAAVEIRPRGNGCAAARALEGKRFLPEQAPALPLTGCTAAKCSCIFAKLTDRRTEERRLEHGGLSASLFQSDDRREKRDRRRTAKASAAGRPRR